ncbi:MAG: UMP kinase [Candidatus Micrarchaeia archaeon]
MTGSKSVNLEERISLEKKSNFKNKISENKFVISVGGSLVVPDSVDTKFLSAFRELIIKRVSSKPSFRFILICGGGKTARIYQSAAKELTEISEDDLDWIGIHATRLNAHLIKTILGNICYKRVLKDPREKVDFGKKKVIVAAGWKPGFSTDYDAVIFAKTYGIKNIINLTNVDYVYDKNPKQFKDARPFKEISWKYYRKLVGDKWSPGLNAPFDPVAAKEAEKLGLTVYILNGNNMKNLENLLEGKAFIGTIIK